MEPPSRTRSEPAKNPAAGEANQTVASATSSTVPTRLIGRSATAAMMESVPYEHGGLGSGVPDMGRQVGSAVGVAPLAASSPPTWESGMHVVVTGTAAVFAAGALLALPGFPGASPAHRVQTQSPSS